MAPSGRVAATLVMVVMGAVFASWGNAAAKDGACPQEKVLVYPVGSTCDQPATYFGEVYELGLTSIIGSIVGGLAPEWDETNATFYVRSAEVGAKYAFSYRTRELRSAVSQSDDVLINNIETGRYLGWRQEGENESFLVEIDDPLSANIFQFVSSRYSSSIMCRFVEPVACQFYHLTEFGSGGSLGVREYVENDVTYFQLSSLHPKAVFGLFRSPSSNGVPRSVIA